MEHAPPPLRQLLYCSLPTGKFDAGGIDDILASCRKNNPPLNVTGFLVFDSKRFLQLPEGPADSISLLYAAIKRDHRHTDARVLIDAAAYSRHFASWFMAYQTVSGDNSIFGGSVTKNMCRAMAKELLFRDDLIAQTVGKFLKKIVF